MTYYSMIRLGTNLAGLTGMNLDRATNYPELLAFALSGFGLIN
jgi:hypothetical protein